MVAAFEAGAPPPEPFDALACDLARHQAASIEGYARLCRARGVDPAKLTSAADIPAVPTDAFKMTRVATFDASDTVTTFRTSGTTVGTRGEHALRDVSTYDAAAIAFGRRWLARDLECPVPVVVLGPSPQQSPDSSLVHMCAAFVEAFGHPAPVAATYLIDADGVLDIAAFDERVAIALARVEPMLILGTSFAFVHFVDAVGQASFDLPRGSRVMQTGGYKGRSREVPPDVLRADLARVFDLDVRSIVGEYGMTELSSQFYERTLFDETAPLGLYAEPPWAKVIPVDPDTLAPIADGAVGIAKVVDLMNVDSAVAVLTQDQVRRVGPVNTGGFELLGRAPGAPPRGCSIAIDEILGRAGTGTE
ncbi:MAG: Long-chain-fatty-acid--luciferin-component ligase [Myxococcaceae bacterium]|nr:Long-chain-fatty-acid--luciferin-component ligase [Myxococcaceae bacterium]